MIVENFCPLIKNNDWILMISFTEIVKKALIECA